MKNATLLIFLSSLYTKNLASIERGFSIKNCLFKLQICEVIGSRRNKSVKFSQLIKF